MKDAPADIEAVTFPPFLTRKSLAFLMISKLSGKMKDCLMVFIQDTMPLRSLELMRLLIHVNRE